MSLTKFILRFAAPLAKIEDFNTYLFIGPHPDDIEIGAGATIAKLVQMGKKVSFLIVTDGRYGTENTRLSDDALIRERKREAIASANSLGVQDVRFLTFSDGGLYDKDELLLSLTREVSKIRPDMILAPDPEVHSEAHLDHKNVGNAVKLLACFSKNPGVMKMRGAEAFDLKAAAFYMTSKPNRYVRLKKSHLSKQLSSIFQNHLTQFPENDPSGKQIVLYLKIRSFDMGRRCLSLHGEGFRMVDGLHMHCLPESD